MQMVQRGNNNGVLDLSRAVQLEDQDRWRAVISQVTWMVCRKFHFQCFNFVDDQGKGTLLPVDAVECTPATAFVVGDHLGQLLVTDAMPREGQADVMAAFGKAVWRLHVSMFSPYEDWAAHQRVEPFSKTEWNSEDTSAQGPIMAALLDLCAFFCLWTEAANLRHMPESIWFFYWAMQHSMNYTQLLQQLVGPRGAAGPYGEHLITSAFTPRPEFLSLSKRRIELRNQHMRLINKQREQYRHHIPFNLDSNQGPVPAYDALTLGSPAFDSNVVRWDMIRPQNATEGDRAVLWDLVLLGDGGAFLDRIVTPVFRALAYEISSKGAKGVEPAMRITYDDANESFVLPQNITRILKDVGASFSTPSEVFPRLWNLGSSNTGWNAEAAQQHYTGIDGRGGWLVKTFQERRTWFATYLAYYRVFAFHILWFNVLMGLSFAEDTSFEGRWWVGMSSAVLTHAVLELVYVSAMIFVRGRVPPPPAGQADIREEIASSATWRGMLWGFFCCCLPRRARGTFGIPVRRTLTEKEEEHRGTNKLWNVKRAWSVPGAGGINSAGQLWLHLVGWVAATAALGFVFLAQFSWFPWPEDDPNDPEPLRLAEKEPGEFFRDVWPVVAAIYGVIGIVMWGPLTQRDGYVITPRSALESLKRCWGAVSSSRAFLGGEYIASVPPKVGVLQFAANIIFWLFVLGCKVCVDYLLVIRQLPAPIKGLLQQNWLGTCGDDLVIGGSEVPCVENMVLVLALCVPVFMVILFDTGILYQVGVFVFGCTDGLVKLGLGQVVTWNDLVKQFERGVDGFNSRVLSKKFSRYWTSAESVQRYYNATGSRGNHQLHLANDEFREYCKWTPFADAWDSIVYDLRLADLVTNDEEANLKFNAVHFLSKYSMKPHVLPVCFFAGKIQRALDEGSVDSLSGKVLLEAFHLFLALLAEVGLLDVEGDSLMRLKRLSLVNQPQNYYHNSVRRKMVNGVRETIAVLFGFKPGADAAALQEKLIKTFVDLLENVLIELEYSCAIASASNVGDVQSQKSAILEMKQRLKRAEAPFVEVNADTGELGVSRRSLLGRTLQELCRTPGADESDPAVASEEIRTLLRVLRKATTLTDQESEPANEEASRVLKFFMSTLLNGSMKQPQELELMRSLTTLVPHYAEGVIYPLDLDEVRHWSKADAKTGDVPDILVDLMPGLDVTTIDFLRIQFHSEWAAFVERMCVKYSVSGLSPATVTERDFRKKDNGVFSAHEGARMDLMLWASERGQMLSRTVKGMMMYPAALRQLEFLEALHDHGGGLDALVQRKFRHIVSSQVYGAKKQSKKPADQWLAMSVDFLMHRYPALRIAYIDMVKSPAGSGGKGVPMSVLLRSDAADAAVPATAPSAGAADAAPKILEVYRVRLPDQLEDGRGVILGEGKPENQNHAMIFCFGECVQTVDMNQENRHAEALKMRNLLQEFTPRNEKFQPGGENVKAYRQMLKNRRRSEPIVALVGFREWIFSGKAGILGQFAASAEFAFGTVVQRVMSSPGSARFHYGHPDVWNKLFTMTRGGVSKATRAFHISEDVFGGYNAIFRGAVIKYKEYISVGKARDVGFAQINGFEAKVAGGNGEQSISRDVHRLGTRLDWFRLMSWYHSGIGFFMNSTLTMASVYLAVWLIFFFALTDSLTVRNGNPDRANGLTEDTVVISTINTVQLFQLGLLSVIPLWGELCLETGFLEGSMAVARQMIAGALMFFIFRQQTSAYYFSQIVYYGGAKYIATGRGFDLVHTPYVKTFTSFGRSHMYFGFQLGVLAVMLAFLDIENYAASTWGTWLVAISLTFSPLWFNPATFRVDTVRQDFEAWRLWMMGSTDKGTGQSWTLFHQSQLEKARNIEGKQTDHGWNRLAGVLMQLFNVVILVALGERIVRPEFEFREDDDGNVTRFEVSGSVRRKVTGVIIFELVLAIIAGMVFVAFLVRSQGANVRRYISILSGIFLTAMLVLYLSVFGDNASAGFTDIVLLAFANVTAAIVIVQVSLYAAPYRRWSIMIVDAGYYVGDTAVSLALFTITFLLAVVQLVDSLQALLLFSSELLLESRRGQQLRLFDAKRGELQATAAPAGGAAVPVAVPLPARAEAASPPVGSAATTPRGARYGTAGAQTMLEDTQRLRGLWARRARRAQPRE